MPDTPTILIVDDEPTNIRILTELLKDKYRVLAATNGRQALTRARAERPPDLILLDIMMPDMNGYEVLQNLKAAEGTREIPVLFLTALTEAVNEARGFDMGAVDYITKPFSPAAVCARVRTHVELARSRASLLSQKVDLEQMVEQRTSELVLTQDATIYSLASLAETRDPETGGHIKRTQHFVRALAEEVKKLPEFKDALESHTIELLFKSAPLHDIGKVGVPDGVLLKPGPLTDAEFDQMKLHARYGRDALAQAVTILGSTTSFLDHAMEIAYTHHEKWDGTGYPEGLKGEDIPLSGRLMALADVYDALTTKRIYKPAFSHEKAVSIILEGRGKHFDPRLVDAFIRIQQDFREIAERFVDSE